MYKHLFRIMFWMMVVASTIWIAWAEYSQVINITWFNESWESWQLIQSFIQKWDDLDIYFVNDVWGINHYTMMDRNMWASEVYNLEPYSGANEASFWWFYQFWNNYWFPSTWNMEWVQTLYQAEHVYEINRSIWSQYIPSKYARNTRCTDSTRMDWTSNSSNWGWIWWWTWDKANSYEWGTTTKSWRKWPCSSWYYIPS